MLIRIVSHPTPLHSPPEFMPISLRSFALGLATAMLFACTNDGGAPRSPENAEIRVVVLMDTTFVPTGSGDPSQEGTNLLAALEARGFDTRPLSTLRKDSLQ